MSEATSGLDWRCPRCRSPRWVAASLTRGMTIIPQCIPCGYYDGKHFVRDGVVVTRSDP
jgi:uncharacterized protein (DUF983 family)